MNKSIKLKNVRVPNPAYSPAVSRAATIVTMLMFIAMWLGFA